jgi:hypothetical protein
MSEIVTLITTSIDEYQEGSFRHTYIPAPPPRVAAMEATSMMPLLRELLPNTSVTTIDKKMEAAMLQTKKGQHSPHLGSTLAQRPMQFCLLGKHAS